MSNIIFYGAIIWVFFEAYLTYLNYLARIKFKEYFREAEPIKAALDEKGHRWFSLGLGCLLTGSVMYAGFMLNSEALVFFILGVVACNAIVDQITFSEYYLCIKSYCARTVNSPCDACQLRKKYDVTLFPLKIIEKSSVISDFKKLIIKIRRIK